MLWVICLVYIVYFSFSTVAAYMANKVVYIIQRQCLRRVRTEQQVRELTESRRYSAWWRWRRPWTGLASAAARDDDRPSSATTRWRTRTRSTTRRRTRDKRSSRCRLPDAKHPRCLAARQLRIPYIPSLWTIHIITCLLSLDAFDAIISYMYSFIFYLTSLFSVLYVLWLNVYCSGCVCQFFNKWIMYVCSNTSNSTEFSSTCLLKTPGSQTWWSVRHPVLRSDCKVLSDF